MPHKMRVNGTGVAAYGRGLFGRLALIALVTLCCAATTALAAGGDLDPAFNPGAGANDAVFDMVLQPDGKAIIIGFFTSIDNVERKRIARLNADGSLDQSFDPSANSSVYTVALARGGKILVGGAFTSIGGVPRAGVALLNPDGSVDPNFVPAGAPDSIVFALAEQPDGKVLVGGAFTMIGTTPRNRLARLNADGSLDTGYASGAGADAQINELTLQPDGKVLAGGFFGAINGTTRPRIARLHTDGSVDASFNPGTGPRGQNEVVHSIALQPDGRIIAGGDFFTFNGPLRDGVVRLHANGAVDFSFDPGSGAGTLAVRRVAYRAGKVTVGGHFSTFNGAARKFVARLNANGSLDTSFNTAGGLNSGVLALAVRPDGAVIVGGTFTAHGTTQINRVSRLLPAHGSISFAATDVRVDEGSPTIRVTRSGGSDGPALARVTLSDVTTSAADRVAPGQLDPSFKPGPGADALIYDAVVQPDDKVIIAGSFLRVGGLPRVGVARLNADGSLDLNFAAGFSGQLGGSGLTVALQPDGKVLVSGEFSSVGGFDRRRIARLNADGSVDTTFNAGTGPNTSVLAIVAQPDGKVLIGGLFSQVNGVARSRIARLNADGSVDTTFDPGSTATSTVEALALQPDGKILAGGTTLISPAFQHTGLVRLNPDGSLDSSFTVADANSVRDLLPLPDGKVLIGGTFTSAGGVTRNCVARLNADGSVDTSFDPGAGASVGPGGNNNGVSSVDVQPDGKVVVAGTFTLFGGVARPGIARLNADGSLDTGFDPGTGPTSGFISGVNVARLQSDGSIVIAGGFTSVSGTPRERVAALVGDLLASWADGDGADKVLALPVADDLLDEPDETLTATLSLVSGPAALGANQTATVTIADNDVPPAITSAPPPSLVTKGVFFSHSFAATGFPAPTFAVTGGALPPGLALTAAGVLSGTPTASGVFNNITVTASNGVTPNVSQTFNVRVNAPPVGVANGYTVNEDAQLAVAAPGVLGNDTDEDGEPLTASLVTGATRGALTFNPDGSFTYAPGANFSGSDSFSYRASDGNATGPVTSVLITVAPINDAPVNAVPSAQTTDENTQRVFSSANGNRVAVSDVDAGNSFIQITLTAANGTLTLGTLAGLNFGVGDGTADAAMTFAGSLFSVNAALDGLRFNPSPGFFGAAGFQIATNDLGRTGSGGQLTDVDSVAINVLEGAAPQFGAAAYSAGENTGAVRVTVLRTGNTAGPVTARVETVDDPAAVRCDDAVSNQGAAYARCDYATTIETVTWAAGDAQPKTISIPLIDDAHPEGPETVRLRVSRVGGTAQATATLTITDSDSAGQPNPIFGNSFFVRMQYLDFLSREPEAGEPWTGVLDRCPNVNGDSSCDRLLVSQSFFQSPESQLKALYSYFFYRVAFDRRPEYSEITPDMRSLAGATPQEVFQRRAQYATAITQRAEFAQLYGAMTNQQYVEALLGRHGLTQITTEDPQDFEGASQVTLTRQQLIDALNSNAMSRAQVLRAVVQSSEVDAAEYHGAFVSMQYYGYLRRTPEQSGYDAWLRVIKQDPQNIRQMVSGFVNSQEYALRFGRP